MRRFYGSPMLVVMFFLLMWTKDFAEVYIPLLVFFVAYFGIKIILNFVRHL